MRTIDEPMKCPQCGGQSPFMLSVKHHTTFTCRYCGTKAEGDSYAEAVSNWNKPYYGGKK